MESTSSAATSSTICKSSNGRSTPSDTNADSGRHKLNKYLRSIVMSRTVFSLFHGFNPGQKNSKFANNSDNQTKPDFTKDNNNEFATAFADVFQRNEAELKITKSLAARLRSSNETGEVTAFSEATIYLPGNDKRSRPKLHIVVGNTASGEQEMDSCHAFIEVGLTQDHAGRDADFREIDYLFWKKTHQAINYLELLSSGSTLECEGGHKLKVVQKTTLLLGVIVTNRKRTHGRMAIYACEPKKEHWRMALMWRREGGMSVLSKAFGYYMSAVQWLTANTFCVEGRNEQWTYLGPNCSKVTVSVDGSPEQHYVLRAYDNRVRQTTRSPQVYHEFGPIKDYTETIVRWIETKDKTIEFRDETYYHEWTLFRSDQKCGKVEVIAVPFLDGRHACSNIGEALSLVRFLKTMHEANFVHGDIRGLNVVFNGEETCLIDHDFGGKEGKAKYPPGYVRNLIDGRRLVPKGETPLSKYQDFRALHSIVFGLHTLGESASPQDDLAFVHTQKRSDSLDFIEEGLKKIDPETEVVPNRDYQGFLDELFTDARARKEAKTQEGVAKSPERNISTVPPKKTTSTCPSIKE